MAFVRVCAPQQQSNKIIVISESEIVDTAHRALVSCTPYAYATCNPDWWGTGSTSTRACYAHAQGEVSGEDAAETYHQTCLTSITVQLKNKYIGKTCKITYSLSIGGRWGSDSGTVNTSAKNGTQVLSSYSAPYMWSGSYSITQTDTFVIENGTITLAANYDSNSKRWGAGATCELIELIIE